MKKITMLLMLLLLMVQGISAKSVKDIINQFKGENKAEYTYVSPAMMLLARAAVKNYSKETGDMLNKVNSVRLLNLDACKSKTKKKLFKEIDNLDEEEYQSIVTNGKQKDGFKMLVKVDPNGTSEFVVLNSGDDNCLLIQVEGTITMEELQKLIDGKEIPGMNN